MSAPVSARPLSARVLFLALSVALPVAAQHAPPTPAPSTAPVPEGSPARSHVWSGAAGEPTREALAGVEQMSRNAVNDCASSFAFTPDQPNRCVLADTTGGDEEPMSFPGRGYVLALSPDGRVTWIGFGSLRPMGGLGGSVPYAESAARWRTFCSPRERAIGRCIDAARRMLHGPRFTARYPVLLEVLRVSRTAPSAPAAPAAPAAPTAPAAPPT